MRHEEKAAGEVREELLQPGARLDVQVIGRLVEEEDVGRLEDGARQGDPHLPARRERRGRLCEIGPGEAQPGQHAVDAFVPRVVAARLQPFLQGVMLPQQGVHRGPCRVRTGFPQLLLQDGHLGQHGAPALEGALRLVPQGPAGKHDARLRNVGEPRVLFGDHRAGVRHGESGHDPHEGGLPAAVGPHQRDTRAAGDGEVHRFERLPLPEGDGDAREADEGHRGATATG